MNVIWHYNVFIYRHRWIIFTNVVYCIIYSFSVVREFNTRRETGGLPYVVCFSSRETDGLLYGFCSFSLRETDGLPYRSSPLILMSKTEISAGFTPEIRDA